MKTRWIIAALGCVALAALVINTMMPWRSSGSEEALEHAGLSCPADAKPANMNYTLKNVDDQDVKLSDYAGKVVLLDFWATWCGPCKVEIPGFIELQDKYGKAGFQVLGVSVDDKPEQLRPYVAEMKMNYPVLQGLGHDDMMDAFGPILGIPTTVIISRDGKICGTHAGLTSKETFESQIKALL
jgi:thiol-disulfide isomerase/thioredoxin